MGHHLKTTLYEGDWLRLVKIGHWESCERTHGQGMAVIVIAVTPSDEILFVEQYRIPLGSRTIEMPAGLVGDDHAQDTLVDAARRELIEEIGVTIGPAEVWKVTEHDYPHALVRLHWCKVYEWSGELQMREGQDMAWQPWPPTVRPVLPGALPVLQWLAAENGQDFDPSILLI